MAISTAQGRRVTAADVARSLGLSRATVGFVLNDTPGQTIPQATRDRVLAEARRLGYRPRKAAQALASGRTRIVLVVLPDWPLDFSLRSNLEEASLALDEAGYSLVTYTPHPTGQARPLWEVLEPDVVFSFTGFSAEQLASLRAAGVRALLPDPDDATIPAWEEAGPPLQIRHLHDLGHRAIAYAGSGDPRIADLVAARRDAARRAAAGLGLALPTADLGDPAAVLTRWLAAGVTAVACYNDDVAALLTGAAVRSGIDVPGRLTVLGHDDAPIASMYVPRLSTVRVDTAGLGRYLAALAVAVAEGTPVPDAPPATTITLVERESTVARADRINAS